MRASEGVINPKSIGDDHAEFKPALVEGSIEALRAAVLADLITAAEPGYDEARALWNTMYDRRPGIIVGCTGAPDVVAAVNFARTHNISVAVRSGGHNIAGTGSCDGGLMLDLSNMKAITVDAHRRIARAEPGLTWGEFDRETQCSAWRQPAESARKRASAE